jgi:phage repressor protein C with HTH and peptisase S24 domain
VSPAAPVRVGDRVVARTAEGAVMAKELARRTAGRIELASLNPAFPELRFAAEQVVWMHRIIWASQ